MSNRILIPRARLSFVGLYEKGEYQGETADKFEATGLIAQDDSQETIEKILAVCQSMLEAKYGSKIPADFKKMLEGKMFGMNQKFFVRDGDQFSYDGYEGMWAIKAANRSQPKLLDGDRSPLTADSGKLYSGSYANMLVEPWIQDNTYGKRINCNLLGVQHVAHGEAFGAGGAVPESVVEDFPELEGETLGDDDVEV